jgi:hypothetical protein
LRIQKSAFGCLVVALIWASTGCATNGTSNSSGLSEDDCIVLNTFSTNKEFSPWDQYEELNEAMDYIAQDAKDRGFSIEDQYYKDWISRTEKYIDVQLRQIEADAGKASVGLGEGDLKTALEAVATDANPGNLGILEGLSTRCLAN